jgi:hypothetical protein
MFGHLTRQPWRQAWAAAGATAAAAAAEEGNRSWMFLLPPLSGLWEGPVQTVGCDITSCVWIVMVTIFSCPWSYMLSRVSNGLNVIKSHCMGPIKTGSTCQVAPLSESVIEHQWSIKGFNKGCCHPLVLPHLQPPVPCTRSVCYRHSTS